MSSNRYRKISPLLFEYRSKRLFFTSFLRKLSFGIGAALIVTSGSWAGEDANALDLCVAAHDACVADCRADDRRPARSICILRCALDEAQCAVGEAAEAVAPWLQRELDELKKFFDDLLNRPPGETAPPPLPPDQDRA
jgi:hypothetical protein